MSQGQPSQDSTSSISIPKEIWALSFGNFFVNVSSVMVRSVFPIYMRTVLGAGAGWIGTVEGMVEAMSFVMKMMSGVYSDYLRQRKFIIILGYIFMFVSKPIFALATNMQTVILAKILERVGNGIQASPRDALVGDFAPPQIRGACYGMRVGMGTAGSFVGSLLALFLMMYLSLNYSWIFWLSVVPGLIAILIMCYLVKEPECAGKVADPTKRQPLSWSDIPRLGRKFWVIMSVVSVFMIAQLGEHIFILHAHDNFGLSGSLSPLVLLTTNFTYSTISYPAGLLSDRIGRYNMLIIGFLCLIVGDLILATAQSLPMAFVGIAICGAQLAITQSIFMTLITDSVPQDLRGTGFGIYYFVCAICAFICNSGAGYISEIYGQEVAFTVSMAIASIALGLLCFIRPKKSSGYPQKFSV